MVNPPLKGNKQWQKFLLNTKSYLGGEPDKHVSRMATMGHVIHQAYIRLVEYV